MIQYSAALRQAIAEVLPTLLGTNPQLVLYQGTIPANCETASTDPIIAIFELPNPYFSTLNGSNTLVGTWTATCILAGTPNYFRLETSAGACILQGVVGYSFSTYWQINTNYTVGQLVVNGPYIYTCIVEGVSATSGLGPSGTGNGIVDGTVGWNYAGIFGDLNFNPPVFTLGETIPITVFQITTGNQ